MRKWIEIFMSVFMCILLSACAHTEKQTQDLMAAVDALGNQAEKAFLSGDVDAMLGYYCDDIISMPDGHTMVMGKTNLKRMTEAIIMTGLKFESLESTPVDVRSGGEYVYEVGTFSQAVIMPGANEPVESTGKYVTIWKRQPDGELKIAVEIYNSDSEAPK
jgi:ketosteroid isomerase-like protein